MVQKNVLQRWRRIWPRWRHNFTNIGKINEESSHATLIIKRIEMEERGKMTIEDEENIEEGRLVVVEIIHISINFQFFPSCSLTNTEEDISSFR